MQAMTRAQWMMTIAAFAAILLFVFFIQPALFPANYKSRDGDLNKVKFGMQVADVQGIMGEPDQSQDLQSAGSRMQMYYYTVAGRQVQISFQNGRVDSINRY